MLTTIKRVYDRGKIILTEEPSLKEIKADIIITFLPELKKASAKPKRILGGLEGEISVPDNFNEPIDELKDCM